MISKICAQGAVGKGRDLIHYHSRSCTVYEHFDWEYMKYFYLSHFTQNKIQVDLGINVFVHSHKRHVAVCHVLQRLTLLIAA